MVRGGKRSGAGRPAPGGAKVRIDIRLTPAQVGWIKTNGGSSYIRRLIEQDMERKARDTQPDN